MDLKIDRPKGDGRLSNPLSEKQVCLSIRSDMDPHMDQVEVSLTFVPPTPATAVESMRRDPKSGKAVIDSIKIIHGTCPQLACLAKGGVR